MATVGVGIVGLSAHRAWGRLAHLPALQALDGLEYRGHTGSSPETARRASEALGLDPTRAFADTATLAANDDIDLLVVCVRAPDHAEIVSTCLAAGKPVLCEWPLARTASEAELLAERARAAGVRTFIGLQAWSRPAIRYLHDLVSGGGIGTVLSTTLSASHDVWGDTCATTNAYIYAHEHGATASRIGLGHPLGALRRVLGTPERLAGTAAITRPVVRNADTGEEVARTSPDQIAASGVLPGGGVFSTHFRAGVSSPRTDWVIDGTEGSIVVTARHQPLHYADDFSIERLGPGGRSGALHVPDSYGKVPTTLGAPAKSVAWQYARLRDDLNGGTAEVPGFDDAVEHHRFLERLEHAAGTGATPL